MLSSKFFAAWMIIATLTAIATPIGVLAAPALVVLADRGEGGSPQQKVLESFASVVVSSQLGSAYDHIDILAGDRANSQEFLETIRRRGRKSAVDVLILTHGSNGAISLDSGDLLATTLRQESPLPGLRLVYMMACYSSSMLQAWRDAGARLVIGHQEVNSLPGFFFPKFIHAWAQGESALAATVKAHRSAQASALMLSGYLNESELLDPSGIRQSEPVLAGVDLDRYGREFPGHDLNVGAQFVPVAPEQLSATALARPAPRYTHSDFEAFSLQALGGMIPGASLRLEGIPSAQKLTDDMGDAVWGSITDAFGNGDGEIWIDGGAVRELLAGLGDFGGAKLQGVIAHLQGVRLTRQPVGFKGAIYFDSAFDLSLQDEASAARWAPYSVHVPRTIRVAVEQAKGVLTLKGLDRGADALELKLKLPVIPDGVFLRQVSVNLSTGKLDAEAGLIHNAVSLVASVDLQTQSVRGVGFWESVRANRDLLFWPDLIFRLR